MKPQINIKKFLKKVPIFSELSDREINKIISFSEKISFKKSEYLFYENDKGKEFYLILSGIVKLYKSDISGRIKTLTYLKEGDFFGEMALLDIEERSTSAQFVKDSEVLVLKGKHFQELILKNPSLSLKMLKTMSARLRETDMQVQDLTFKNLEARVASSLLYLASKHGENTPKGRSITLELTHQELAELVGTAREVITAILNTFKKSGCISVDKHRITIVNSKELKSWIV